LQEVKTKLSLSTLLPEFLTVSGFAFLKKVNTLTPNNLTDTAFYERILQDLWFESIKQCSNITEFNILTFRFVLSYNFSSNISFHLNEWFSKWSSKWSISTPRGQLGHPRSQ